MTILENDFKKWNYKAIKLHQVCTPFKNDSPEINQIAKFAAAKQMPLFIHLWSKDEAVTLMNVAKITLKQISYYCT